jgi:hypothetical protein
MELCPSEFALDDAQIHGGAAPRLELALHVDQCPRCRARVSGRERIRARFEAEMAGPLWRQLAARRRRRRFWPWLLCAPVIAAAVVAIVFVPWGPPHAYVGVKGDPKAPSEVTVEIAGRRDGEVFDFDNGRSVAPGDELQLTVRTPRTEDRYVLVGGFDRDGKFSPFYPANLDGHSVPLPPRGQPLRPLVVLDDAPGPERIMVAVSRAPLEAAVIAPLAEDAAASGRGDPRPRGALAADGVTVRWIVVPKNARRGAP